MSNEEFDRVLEFRLEETKRSLGVKAKEYVRNGDRMHNFNRGAALAGTSRERVLLGYLNKHLVSFLDMVDDLEKGYLPSEAYLDEKVGDIINYMILFEASVKNQLQQPTHPLQG